MVYEDEVFFLLGKEKKDGDFFFVATEGELSLRGRQGAQKRFSMKV